jgi:L-threonylcarbamoyladenylate synthase
MKYRHYAPKSPLILLDGELSDIIDYIVADDRSSKAVLCYSDDKNLISEAIPTADLYVMGARDDISEQAKHLFSILRDADKHSYDVIFAPLPSQDGVGLALYNRMIRAAAHTIINLRQGRNG